MKTILSIIFLLSLFQSILAAPSHKLIDALVHVESKGRSSAVGDNGKALGILQIHKEVVDDVNRAYGTSYEYDDRKSVELSREICCKYLILHGGHWASDEKYARIWNGGPRGHRKPRTKRFWRKVKMAMSIAKTA